MSSANSEPVKSFNCDICGKQFDSLGDMQRHQTVDHIQKGEIKSKASETA